MYDGVRSSEELYPMEILACCESIHHEQCLETLSWSRVSVIAKVVT
jgi:hypothetical protein